MYANSTCVITGASAGLGAAFARELSERGARRLVLVARREERLQRLAEALDCEAVVEPIDLADPKAVQGLIERHSPDVLVNNAGFGHIGPLSKASGLPMIDVNVRALTQLIEGWLPSMVERGRGGILNVGSTAGMVPTPYMATYAASKAYVNSLSEGLRGELAGTGVHITCLAPGPVATEFFGVAAPRGTPPPSFILQAPQVTVHAALSALEHNRALVIPGLAIKLMMFARKWSPDWMVRFFMVFYGRTLLGMT